MKKLYTTIAAVALLCGSINAQTFHILDESGETGYAVLGISPNGKYIAGSDMFVSTGFIADWQAQDIVDITPEIADMGCEFRHVSNNGIAVGFNGDYAVKYDYAKDELTTYTDWGPALLEDISADGSVTCGHLIVDGWVSNPIVVKEDKVIKLPIPTEEELGAAVTGATAKWISADGKVVVGWVVDDLATYPAIIWKWDDASSTYKFDIISKKYWKTSWEDTEHPYDQFMPADISDNGKFVALIVTTDDGQGNIDQMPAHYNIETGELTIAEYATEGTLVEGTPFTSGAIANDGTIVGYTGDMMGMSPRQGFIWKAGEKTPQLLATAFPAFKELVGYDTTGMHAVSSITPDCKYISGFALTGEGGFVTYIIETGMDNGMAIENTNADNDKAQKVVAEDGTIYIIRGGHTYTLAGTLVK